MKDKFSNFFKNIKLPKFNLKNKQNSKKEKKLNLSFSFKSLLKKYNYNIEEVVGVKGEEKYILYVDKKLIRIYRGNLKSTPLLCSFIPIEDAIFYNFEVEKNVINKVDIKSFIEAKVYEEAGIEETENYDIKYKIIDSLKDEKYVIVETIIIPESKIEERFSYLLKETGYIDYLSFPAFAYKALYEEKIIQKANDLFVVLLKDKISLTFYSDGELIAMTTLSGGLDKAYSVLEELKIKDFNEELFIKLLLKKGFSIGKYSTNELVVLEKLKEAFFDLSGYLIQEMNKIKEKYNVGGVERVFITSEYGEIEGINKYLEGVLDIEVNNFEFYEKYNLDRLPIDPFLFLAMLETHYAYKYNNQDYNFSKYLRKPTFFYRPSGILLLVFVSSILFSSIYPLYLYIQGKNYEYKNKLLNKEISNIIIQNAKLNSLLNRLKNQKNLLTKKANKLKKEIDDIKLFIKKVYIFKYSYLPKSQSLVDITYLLNKNKVYLESLSYKESYYFIKVFSYKEKNIPNLIEDLTDKGFLVNFDTIEFDKNKYTTLLKVKE